MRQTCTCAVSTMYPPWLFEPSCNDSKHVRSLFHGEAERVRTADSECGTRVDLEHVEFENSRAMATVMLRSLATRAPQ
jgi:hypothetical protein